MTTQGKNLEELGRRAVACKHWRWMPGMRIVHTSAQAGRGKPVAARLCSLGDDDAFVMESQNAGTFPSPFTGNDQWTPDLSDPATLGCLLHLVREAWKQKTIYVEHDKHSDSPWIAIVEMIVFDGQGEAEALVAALEAAP